MTRGDEINKAADAYTSQMCNDCSARLYCEERNKKCVEYREQAKVFADAVKWADKHPKNVWHSADEEPEGKDWKIILEDKYGSSWVMSSYSVFFFYGDWQGFTKDNAWTRWAYIPELLPKGGEEL